MPVLRTAACVLSGDAEAEAAAAEAEASGYDDEGPLLQKHGVLTLSGRHVFCPDETLSSVLSFEVDDTYGAGSSTLDLFSSTLAPVVSGVTRGEAGTAVFCSRSMDDSMVQELVCGIATLASQAILDVVNSEPVHAATTDVRVAWFEMRDNAVTDLLRTVTDPANARGLCVDKESGDVEGLLEVQITTATDVLKLMQNVQQAHGDFAPGAHSVFQIAVHERALVPFDDGAMPLTPSRRDAAASPKATKLTIATLGCAPSPAASAAAAFGGGGAAAEDAAAAPLPHWRRALDDVVDALTAGRPTVPYRSSPLTAFLRNALELRCNACFVSILYPRLENIGETLSALKFTAAVRAVHGAAAASAGASGVAAVMPAMASATTARPSFLSPVFEGGSGDIATPRAAAGEDAAGDTEFALREALSASHRGAGASPGRGAARSALPPPPPPAPKRGAPPPGPFRSAADKQRMADLATEMRNEFGLGMGLGANSMEDAVFAGGAAAMEWCVDSFSFLRRSSVLAPFVLARTRSELLRRAPIGSPLRSTPSPRSSSSASLRARTWHRICPPPPGTLRCWPR